MGKCGCAVYNCQPDHSTGRYRFPNPNQNLELFLTWVQLMGNVNLTHLDQNTVYRNCRVCRKHFTEDDMGFNNCLKKGVGVVPKLFLPGRALTPIIQDNVDTLEIEYDHQNDLGSSSTTSKETENSRHTPSFDGNAPMNNSLNSPPPRTPPYSTKQSLLKGLHVHKSADLSPKARRLYNQAFYYKKRTTVLTNQRVKYKSRLQNITKDMTRKSMLLLDKSLTKTASTFFKSQIKCFGKKPKGRRFNIEEKVLALAIYKQSPTAYKLLSSIFALPCRATLQNLLSRIPIGPGIHDAVFDTLKGVAKKMKPINKTCVLLFDEMSLQPHLHYNPNLDEVEGFQDFGTGKSQDIANHVQVYMLRGIGRNWKQPVGFSFVKGGVKAPQIVANIKNIITEAKTAGLNVIATVCDQGAHNVSAINKLVAESQQKTGTNDYLFEVNGDRIVPIFDVPHLLKSIRNNLLTKDIHFVNYDGQKRVAKWEHIYNAWLQDGFSTDLRAMPKVTEHHVNKAKINKMKVSICAQVFSHSVASTMKLLIGNRSLCDDTSLHLGEDALGTMEFLKMFDELFDSVNGSAQRDMVGKPLRTSVPVDENCRHVDFWKATLPVLESMHVFDKNKRSIVPCFTNWQRTVKGFMLLRTRLRECGFKWLKSRRLNQDPLENFFGRIRQRGHRFTNPTCSAFVAYYKSLLVNGLVSKHSVGSNCQDDEGEILVTLQRFLTQGLPEEDNVEEQLVPVKFPENFQPLKPLEAQALAYVAGFIAQIAPSVPWMSIKCPL